MDYKELLGLIEAVDKSNLTKFSYKEGNMEIEFEKQSECVGEDVEHKEVEYKENVEYKKDHKLKCEELRYIKSPLVGTFYSKPSPDEKPFISVGDKISKNQVIGIIEVMKMMNEVKSDFDGIVQEILIEDNETVDYGQSLVKIRLV